MPLPTIAIIGNLTADPELRHTNAGKAWTTFRVASNERRKNEAGEWIDGDSLYIDVTSWRAAEQIKEQLTKGSRVIVYGTLRSREYEAKSGEKRTAIEINAELVAIQIREGEAPRTITATTGATDPWTTNAPAQTNPWPTATNNDNTPF